MCMVFNFPLPEEKEVDFFFAVNKLALPEKAMPTHSSTLAWKIPWTEEPGRLHTVHGVAKSWT